MIFAMRKRGRKRTEQHSGAATALAKDLDGLAFALEQAAAYFVTRRKAFAEYDRFWQNSTAVVREAPAEISLDKPQHS